MSSQTGLDTIIIGGYIRTMDENNPVVSAVGIKDGLIACAGGDHEVLSHRSPRTKVIDAAGRCVMPGFIDSHMHLLGWSAGRDAANLMDSRSVKEVTDRVAAYMAKRGLPKGAAVLGRGWNQNMFEDAAFPTAEDLDAVSVKHPMVLTRACGHMAVLNSLALEMSGINAETRDPEGGVIGRFQDGRPNGLLFENALDLINLGNREHSTDEIKALITAAAAELAKRGVTSVHSDDFGASFPAANVCEAYTSLAREGRLTLRVSEQCRANNLRECEDILAMPQPPEKLQGLFRLGAVKLMTDGSLGARTAYLRESYADDPGNRGVSYYTPEELQAMVDAVHNAGRNVVIHAIGDGAVSMVLDCIAEARRKNPRPDPRHGVVHAQITDRAMVERFHKLEALAYIQPIFINADAHIVEARVGADLARTSYAFQSLNKSGVRIPFGTDCPVEPPDTLPNLYCAVSRRGLDGFPEGGYNPSEALSIQAAARAYTADGAYASFEEHTKGMIKPGQYADLVMLSRNIFTMAQTQPHDPVDILKTEVDMTVFGGKVVYERR